MDNEDILFFAIIGALLFSFLPSVNALTLSYGQCITYADSNGTITEFCAPPSSSAVIQLRQADFGVAELLNYTCLSGEIVRNAPPIEKNITVIQYVYNTTTIYQDRNFTIERNITVYLNQTVENTTFIPKIFDLKKTLDFNEEFLDWETKLQLKAPAFPLINENILLSGGESKKYEKYGLVVGCYNTTAFCATPVPGACDASVCQQQVESARINASSNCSYFASTPNPVSQTATSGGLTSTEILVGLVVIGMAAFWFWSERQSKEIKKTGDEFQQSLK